MKLVQLLEAKKTHDECSDEIDGYHAEARDALAELKKLTTDKDQLRHLEKAQLYLQKAIRLATSWERRCG